ncbi:pentapeptide repeat-containing protein [Streptomyces sp. NPDC018029]|uniref:pentapeptide repeat-containing protein n=1 Tax=Streptomyces sp. NPDC018029 TaxID=3365032 RepID=UPI00379EDB58
MAGGLITGIAAVLAVVVTTQQMRADIRATHEEQIANRYTAAVNNLGNESADVRLGGVYALQRIMQDSPRDQPAIVDVLSAYVRTHARSSGRESAGYKGRPEADVHSAFEILARRNPDHDGAAAVDLREAYLPQIALRRWYGPDSDEGDVDRPRLSRANLSGANLASSDLSGADMSEVFLSGAKLPSADLDDADLRSATLFHADLTNATLQEAQMARGSFVEATFVNASLRGADLRGADLRGVDLKGADLKGADLRGADLRPAQRRKVNGKEVGRETGRTTRVTVEQLASTKLGPRTKLPSELAKDARVKKRIAEGKSKED